MRVRRGAAGRHRLGLLTTGRTLAAEIVVQASADLSWSLLPNFGSHYDPAVSGTLLALLASLIALTWGRELAPSPPAA